MSARVCVLGCTAGCTVLLGLAASRKRTRRRRPPLWSSESVPLTWGSRAADHGRKGDHSVYLPDRDELAVRMTNVGAAVDPGEGPQRLIRACCNCLYI
jgi:hypothetical protein